MLDVMVCTLSYAMTNVIPGDMVDAIVDVLYFMQYAMLYSVL